MKRYGHIFTFLFLVLITTGRSQQNFFPILGGQRVGTSVFTFLKIGVSARAMGMAEAVVALNQDASGLYYNPAIIAQLANTQISATRVEWPADIYYDFFGISKRIIGSHYFAVNAAILHMEPMKETTEFMPHGTGNYFTFRDRLFGITYGVRMSDRFSFGVTLKNVSEDLAGEKMEAWLLDLGTFYWTGYKSLRFSASLTHFGAQSKPTGTYERRILDRDTGDEILIDTEYEYFSPPTIFRVGTAIDFISGNNQMLTVAIQLNHPVDNAENIVAGMEYLLFNSFALRSGYKFNNKEENMSAGVGFYLPVGSTKIKIDYSYTNLLHLSDPSRLSLGFEF